MKTIDKDDLKLHEIEREIKVREILEKNLAGQPFPSTIRAELEKLYRMRDNYLVQHSPKPNIGDDLA